MTDPVFGCATLTSNTLRATISEQPRIQVSATDTLVCLNKPIQLRVTGTNPNHPNPRFVWQYRIPGTSYIYLLKDTLSMYSPPTNRLGTLEYRVQYTLPISGCFTSFSTPIPIRVQFNCDAQEDEVQRLSFSNIDIVENKSVLWMDIFPNPTSEMANIHIYLPNKERAKLTITDLLGKKVFEKDFIEEEGSLRLKWEPTLGLTRGIYIAVLQSGNQQLTKRIIRINE